MENAEEAFSSPEEFEKAWDHPQAYSLIKNGISQVIKEQNDFNPEYPYDMLVSLVATTGMIHSAFELDKKIEVRYDWEALDEDNIMMHSCVGKVEIVDAVINAKSKGFVMSTEDEDGQGGYIAFEYSKIFWVCAAK